MSYISSAFPRFAEHMEPHEIAFQLAKSGKLRQLKQYLNRRTKDERKRIISTKYNGATSLIMSCRNGHFEVVEFLVESCGAGLEQSGLVNFEGENIEGAPPLWCASAAGHLKIVKYLVSKGANVNSTTKSNSTALRAACFDGHIEIVRYLVENSADIEIANRHGHTCLMIACYKGHLAISKYLISRGADLNRKSVKGNTALHDCAECGSLEIMKLLLSHNAKMASDSYKMTPLLAAAVTGHAVIVEYLLTREECVSIEKIHALELLGATFVDKKHDMLSAYGYWKTALERRSNPLNSIQNNNSENIRCNDIIDLSKEKTVQHNPIEAYEFATEFITQAELDEIIADPDDMRMQALLIRERILGPTHPDTTYYIRYRGAVYADCGNFRKCILLWLYALDTQKKCLEPLHPMIQSSFLSFTELFQYMQKQLSPLNGGGTGRDAGGNLTNNDINKFSTNERNSMFNIQNMYTATVLKILQQAVEEIKRGLYLLKQQQEKTVDTNSNKDENSQSTKTNTTISTIKIPNELMMQPSLVTPVQAPNSKSPFDMSHFDRTLVVIVHFLIVVAESMRHCSPEEMFKLKKLVYELVKLNPKNSKMSSLLHLASSRDSSSIIKNHTLSSFPSTEVLKLLLECGADSNALDAEKNSPLHLAASNRSQLTTIAPPTVTVVPEPQNLEQEQNLDNNNNQNIIEPAVNGANVAGSQTSPVINNERDKLIFLLLNSGTHLDACNAHGKTAADLYKSGKMYQIINPINYLNLQCLAAKVIKKNKIKYREHLTEKLGDFVSIH
jgi:ankyrin repeat protein